MKQMNMVAFSAKDSLHTWTSTFAKLSINEFEKVKIAAIHPDFV